MKTPLILIVEDETKLASLLSDYLQDSGYKTHCLNRGDEAMKWFKKNKVDLILLDLMLPGIDGLSICRELRSESSVPIIMVTARVEEIDRLLGLELGADDYICKPFSPREVVARVKAVLRRASIASNNHECDSPHSSISIDIDKYLASANGIKLDLTPVEFRLLQTLSTNTGQVFSRNQLLDIAYTDYRVVSDRTVDSHIKNLRKKLTKISPEINWIESVYGVGYRFNDQPDL